jgi:class 3 adenylate cyclase
LKTKTFRNEKDAIELSKKVEEILKNHNKFFKQKIDFGISINFGEIVGRMKGKNDLEFMAMKNLISNSKKLAELSSGEILLSRDFRDKAGGMIKTYEKEVNGNKVYTIREIRDREQHARFIANFLNTLERDKKEKERRESKN